MLFPGLLFNNFYEFNLPEEYGGVGRRTDTDYGRRWLVGNDTAIVRVAAGTPKSAKKAIIVDKVLVVSFMEAF